MYPHQSNMHKWFLLELNKRKTSISPHLKFLSLFFHNSYQCNINHWCILKFCFGRQMLLHFISIGIDTVQLEWFCITSKVQSQRQWNAMQSYTVKIRGKECMVPLCVVFCILFERHFKQLSLKSHCKQFSLSELWTTVGGFQCRYLKSIDPVSIVTIFPI